MLDAAFLREHLDEVERALATRGLPVETERFQKLDRERRTLLAKVDELRQRRNTVSKEVSRLKAQGQPADALIEEMRRAGEMLKDLEHRLGEHEAELTEFLVRLPNLPHPSVPLGRGPADNREVARWGEPPRFTFTPRPHWELGEALGILDFERAARMAGSRFVLSLGLGAALERALVNFMVDLHTGSRGYIEVLPPFLVNRSAMLGTGQLPVFEDDMFRLKDDDYFLVPTAEVPLTNIHRDEILPEERLPIAYAAATPCFRREAGSYGQDTRGLIRQHQFNKVELVWVTTPEQSDATLERLRTDAEEVLRRLELHYRVVVLCTGDLGFAATKTYDLEVWLPGQGAYKEISSCSHCGDFQARRLGIRYRAKASGRVRYVHTLNGSGLAVGRTLVAVLEQGQQEDGSVVLPEALRPYLRGLDRIRPAG